MTLLYDDHLAYYSSLPPLVAATGFPDQPSAPILVAPRILTDRTAALFDPSGVTDAGRNFYWTIRRLRGNTTEFPIYVEDETGQNRQLLATVVLPGIDKGDGGWLGIAGGSLWVILTSHEAISGERDNNVHYLEIPGVVRVPYPAGQVPQGGAFDGRGLMASGGGGSSEPSLTEDQVRNVVTPIVVAQIDRLVALFGSGNIRTAIMHKVWDGLVGLMDPANPDPRSGAYRFLLAGFIRDRVFEVLRDNGLIDPQAATRALEGDSAERPAVEAFLAELRAAGYDTAPAPEEG